MREDWLVREDDLTLALFTYPFTKPAAREMMQHGVNRRIDVHRDVFLHRHHPHAFAGFLQNSGNVRVSSLVCSLRYGNS